MVNASVLEPRVEDLEVVDELLEVALLDSEESEDDGAFTAPLIVDPVEFKRGSRQGADMSAELLHQRLQNQHQDLGLLLDSLRESGRGSREQLNVLNALEKSAHKAIKKKISFSDEGYRDAVELEEKMKAVLEPQNL